MRLTIFVASLGIAFATLASTAEAMPVNPLSAGATSIEQVAFGCGPGFHPGPYGRCVRNRRFFKPRPVFRPPFRACPRGFHLGPAGRCRPNF